jgi:hypothetical protein
MSTTTELYNPWFRDLAEQQSHEDMMDLPEKWFHSEFLPLKHPERISKDRSKACFARLAIIDGEFVVTMDDDTVEVYDSAEDIIRDGWVVD